MKIKLVYNLSFHYQIYVFYLVCSGFKLSAGQTFKMNMIDYFFFNRSQNCIHCRLNVQYLNEISLIFSFKMIDIAITTAQKNTY